MTTGRLTDPMEEAYWSALLNEGEHTKTVYLDDAEPQEEFALASAPTSETTSDQDDWQLIEAIHTRDDVLEMAVVGYNRGGLLVEWRNLRGFVPASQLSHFPTTRHPEARREALSNRIGERLKLRVIELEPDKNRLILSERAAEVANGKRHEILTELKAGDIIEGRITNLCDFGAFVDLGGIEGLIHISELSWGRVSHPADLLESDQLVRVCVLEVDKDNARIALSIKRLRPDPWKTVQERYHIGQIVEGRVTHVVDFGAFACLEEGLEGLIHISELAEGNFLHPRNVVSEGDTIRARILTIDGHSRRLGLSLRLV